ncbi:unnamed protein product [Eruca vesicaria subsp. sativa]|uniref:FKB95-like N-terminal Kelch domain-containing protein n=1 Tax=Eruca vesicaria subsp. sativa TaxID=29727 RepID=A0ABC8JL90_ERUVS|nr:unnamed protein product [Eruca vesicaria subsp. sativa]
MRRSLYTILEKVRDLRWWRCQELNMVGGLFYMCAVADELYCYYFTHGLMGYDTKLKVWRRVVGLETLGAAILHNAAMVDYDGKLVIFWHGSSKKEIRCAVIMLDLIGDVIREMIEWCGIVDTMPYNYSFQRCFVCSDD